MARLPIKRLGGVGRFALLAQVIAVLVEHWNRLDDRDRRRVREVVTATKGNPRNLTPGDREDLRRIARDADLPGAARKAASLRVTRRR